MWAIIGGGLAGASLAKTLSEFDVRFDWYLDYRHQASHISSGIINPISGRNYALSWRYDEFSSFAYRFYGDFIEKVPIKRKIYPSNNPKKQDKRYEELKEYMHRIDDDKYLWIKNAFRVRVPEFIDNCIDKYQSHVIQKKVELSDIKLQSAELEHKKYDYIIFAEGIEVLSNSLFNSLPFTANRGQVLKVDIDNYPYDYIFHDKKTICPFQNQFWVGSSFERVEISEPTTTDELYEQLMERLQYFISDDSSIKHVEHLGAFRSTTRDRRPIIGRHKEYPSMVLFNGFGTKGASLIPYFSSELYHYLVSHRPLNKEVDIERFY